ncbi:MAG: serine protease [Gracilibacteraceae bacterium]|nr:serine protease [Gracilibacteraceae bacterium]
MPNWSEILNEISCLTDAGRGDALDVTRRKYLKTLSEMSGRNIIAYYSGFLSNINPEDVLITDMDKNGFMSVINKLDRNKGLDLILHTPGGDLAATESLVEYLRSMFGDDIRAIVPQIAMSAGSMIACSCKSIVMGKQSSIGPIDPQFRGIPASGVIEEFERARDEISRDPSCIPLWHMIIGKYHPTFIGECEKAILWSKEIVTKWLVTNMLKCDEHREATAKAIVDYLSDHNETKAHARHIGLKDCQAIGLKVLPLEENGEFQDAVLSVHHAYMITFSLSSTIKIIENQNGIAMMISRPQISAPIPLQTPYQLPLQEK